jgi:hypothetical protein
MNLVTSPKPPDAWLVVYEYKSGEKRVQAIVESPGDSTVIALRSQAKSFEYPPSELVKCEVIKDDPALEVVHSGIPIINPACLTARDNWFNRYETLLRPHLKTPKPATVFTFAKGALSDPLQSHKSSKEGPFPLPKGATWPVCVFCEKKMSFLGVLDFRDSKLVAAPNGSLVLHVCEACGAWESHAATWIMVDQDVEIIESPNPILAGSRWETNEFLTPRVHADEIATDPLFFARKRNRYRSTISRQLSAFSQKTKISTSS